MIDNIKISGAWKVEKRKADKTVLNGIFLNTGKGTWTQNLGAGEFKYMINGNYGVRVYKDGSLKCRYSKTSKDPETLYKYLLSLNEQDRIEYAENTYESLKRLEKFKL